MNEIQSIKDRLNIAIKNDKLSSGVRSCAFEFEDALLGKNEIEVDAFEFLLETLNNAKLLKWPDTAVFLSIINTEFHLFSTIQIDRLVELVKSSKYFLGSAEDIVAAGADLVARRLPKDLAIELFRDARASGNDYFHDFGNSVLAKQ